MGKNIILPKFVGMKIRYSYKDISQSDTTTYLLVAVVVLTTILGAIKIVFL